MTKDDEGGLGIRMESTAELDDIGNPQIGQLKTSKILPSSIFRHALLKLSTNVLSSARPNMELVYNNHCYYDPQVVHLRFYHGITCNCTETSDERPGC